MRCRNLPLPPPPPLAPWCPCGAPRRPLPLTPIARCLPLRPAVKLNANRNVTGQLRGFDQFMNIVLDNTVEEVSETERNEIGLVVIRGNSIVMMECLERI